MGMTSNVSRIGNFTSSEIYRLMKNGKAKGTIGAPAYEYVAEKNMERRLGRSLNDESDAKALAWGSLCEKRVFDMLPMDYILFGDETNLHPEIPYWAGSPDATRPRVVSDVKCPITLKSFCNLVDHGNDINAIRENHKDGEKYYWQLISNAVLTNSDLGELIVYVPYQEELQKIRDLILDLNGEEYKRYARFINMQDDELPHLIKGGHYKNLNKIEFEIPRFDKEALRERVEEMGKLLITVN